MELRSLRVCSAVSLQVQVVSAQSDGLFSPCPAPFSLEISKNRPIDADSG